MPKCLSVLLIIILCTILTSSQLKKNDEPSKKVKEIYLNNVQQFIKDVESFQLSIASNTTTTLQQQFFICRKSYKKIETLVEYYFPYYAAKLNGPPIPFYEDAEADKGQQQPEGMQVIEGLVFPKYEKEKKDELEKFTSILLFHSKALLQTNESFAFNDEFITDAVIEELYRITAMGIAGFDSQVAFNGLPECATALKSIITILTFYKEKMDAFGGADFDKVEKLIADAIIYINKAKNFNDFNRMNFILNYLNPITKKIITYKLNSGFASNNSPRFYSLIKKNNTLFAPNNFDVYKYLDDNKFSASRIELGRNLFFDAQLSSDGKRSCASCHQPNKAFTDGLAKSVAIDGHTTLPRNAPTLWNAALQRNLFYDSRSKTLEEQVMAVLNNVKEMNGSAQAVGEKIIAQPQYALMYKSAYPNAPTTDAGYNICNAIACYQRTLLALNSSFDKHMNEQPILTSSQINGFNLFMGKAKCGTCHFAPLFNGNKPPRFFYTESEVLGVPKVNVKRNAILDTDEGRFVTTALPLHKYAFKTPTLRNAAVTAPYMHNGIFKTLEEVVDFYNNGGGQGLKIAPNNQTLPFDKLNLTKKEKKELVLFMKALTDTTGVD